MALEIYKRGKYWWIHGRVGKHRIHESTGQIDRQIAEVIKTNKEKSLTDELVLGVKATWTVAQAIDLYVDSGKSSRFLLPLLDHFKDTRVSELTGVEIRAAAPKIYPGRTYTTWNRQVVIPMRAVINFSHDAGKCPAIKLQGFTKRDPGIKKAATEPKRAVDYNYIDRFREHATNPYIAAMMLFFFQTGARLSDAMNLEPEDLKLDERKAILRDMKNGEDGVADLTSELVAELRQLPPRGGRVFGYRTKKNLYKQIKKTCARAGIPYLGTHQPGRHSFATMMIVGKGIDHATTAEKGRWKTKRVLMEHYVHGSQDDVIEDVFGRGKGIVTEDGEPVESEE